MLLAFLALAVGFAGGFFVGLKNANSSKVEKAKDELDYLESRERVLRYVVDSSVPPPNTVTLSRRACF